MVNSKKMSKSTIAVILLSLLLCLSLVLTATGAWFTDADDGTGATLTFGEVDIEVGSDSYGVTAKTAELSGADIMPGDTVSASVTVNNVKEKVYVRITVTAKDTLKETALEGSGALTLTNVKFDGATITAGADGSYYAAIAKEANGTFTFDVELTAGAYGNEYQTQTLTFAVNVQAIQQANNGSSAEAAFANYTADGKKA